MNATQRNVGLAAVASMVVALWPTRALANATCTLAATGPAFGTYDPFSGTADTANGSVLATCTYSGGPGTTNVFLTASYSTGFSGSYGNRYMLSGINRLYYNIYVDAAFTRIWGNGTGGTQAETAKLTVSSRNRSDSSSSTIYGRIPAGQNAMPGIYADTITITVTY